MVKVIVVKEVEPGNEFQPVVEPENELAFLNEQAQGAFFAAVEGRRDSFFWLVAPSETEVAALVVDTYGGRAEDAVYLAKNILALFGCGDLRIEQEVDGERSRAE